MNIILYNLFYIIEILCKFNILLKFIILFYYFSFYYSTSLNFLNYTYSVDL